MRDWLIGIAAGMGILLLVIWQWEAPRTMKNKPPPIHGAAAAPQRQYSGGIGPPPPPTQEQVSAAMQHSETRRSTPEATDSQRRPAARQEPMSADEVATFMAASGRSGFLQKWDPDHLRCYVNPRFWAIMNVDQKRGATILFSRACGLPSDGPFEVMDYMTGKRLAKLDARGFRVD